MMQVSQPVRARWPLTLVAGGLLLWMGCDSPSAPSGYLIDAREYVDTLYVVDTVLLRDTIRITQLPTGSEATRLGGSLAWGGGPPIGSSSHVVARLPDGRWGIGTDAPQASLDIGDGDFRVQDGRFSLLVSGDFQGNNPAGFGLNLDRQSSAGPGPMGINLRQDGVNFWGTGLDENVTQPYPDFVSVFESATGDVFRFRAGGRAILGKGIGHPEPNHVLTIIDRDNNLIENVLNLQISPDGNARRFIRSYDGDTIRFAVGKDGRVGIGRDFSATAMLTVDGSAEARSFVRLSDARLKIDVIPIHGSLSRVRALRPVSFRWRDMPARPPETGLLAQEVARVLPDAVRVNGEGYQTVDYQAISIELLRAVQELSSEVERLGDALARLEGAGHR